MDHIELVDEHISNEWKFYGFSYYHKEKLEVARRHDNASENTSSSESDDIPSDEEMESNNSSFKNNHQTGFSTFFCDEPGCVKRFVRFQNLVNHHARGDHVFKPNKVRLRDKPIELFKNSIEQAKPHQIRQLQNFTTVSNPSTGSSSEQSDTEDETKEDIYKLQQGWALLDVSDRKSFSSEQINYLNEKYEEDKASGSKWDANAVVLDMQNKKYENGNFMFDPSEFLPMSQIKSYFSRLTRKQRLQGNQSQSYRNATNNEYNEEETDEAEKDFLNHNEGKANGLFISNKSIIIINDLL